MKPLHKLLLSMPLLALPQPFLRAAQLDPKTVPADAQWLIHVDMDAALKSKSWETLTPRLAQNPDAQAKIDALSDFMGLHFPADFHAVTLFGSTFADHAGVVLLNAAFDAPRITSLLQTNEAYKKISYNSHDILSWLDKDSGKIMFGSFASPALAVLADSVEQVQTTLDVLDGKAKSLAPDDTLLQGKGTTILFYLAGKNLAALPQKPESPLLAQLSSAWFTVSQEADKLVIRSALNAKDADAAEKIKSMAEGFRSFIILSASGDSPDPKTKFAAALVQAIVLKLDGTTLAAELPLSNSDFAALFDTMGKTPPAPKAPGK